MQCEHYNFVIDFLGALRVILSCFIPSQAHLRTKVTPSLDLTYSKIGEIWGRYENIKVIFFKISP